MRLYALDSVDIEPLRTDLMARLEHHRDRFARYERLLNKRFPQGTAPPADVGKLLGLRIGLPTSAPWRSGAKRRSRRCRRSSAGAERTNVVPIEDRPARKQRLTARAGLPEPADLAPGNF